MATINDVAKKAGVSRSTVSLVINKRPLVKRETRELVERVIAEMNYVPNSNARGLSAKITNNIGVVFIHCRTAYYINQHRNTVIKSVRLLYLQKS